MLCLAGEQPRAVLLQGGILSIDIDPTDPSVVATAGMDHNVHIFSRQVFALLPASNCKHRLLHLQKTYSHNRQFVTSLCALRDQMLWG